MLCWKYFPLSYLIFLLSYSFLSCDRTGFILVLRPVSFMPSDSIQPSFPRVVLRTIFSWVILECNIFHVTLIVHIVVPNPVVPIPPRWFVFYLQLLPPLSAPLHGHILCWLCYTMAHAGLSYLFHKKTCSFFIKTGYNSINCCMKKETFLLLLKFYDMNYKLLGKLCLF